MGKINWYAKALPCEKAVERLAKEVSEILAVNHGELIIKGRSYGEVPREMFAMRIPDGDVEGRRQMEVHLKSLLRWAEKDVAFKDRKALPAGFLAAEQGDKCEVWAVANCSDGRFLVGFAGEMKNNEYLAGMVFAVTVLLARHYNDVVLWQSANILAKELLMADEEDPGKQSRVRVLVESTMKAAMDVSLPATADDYQPS